MKGYGSSFGAQARAAELNAAAAAKARNGDMNPWQNDQSPSMVPEAYYQPPFGPAGNPNTTPSRPMKPLSAEAPHYTPKSMDNERLLNRVGMRTPSHGFPYNHNNNGRKAAHPLRMVTTLDASNGNGATAGMLHNYPLQPDLRNVHGGPRVMGPDDISPTKQEEKLAIRDRKFGEGTTHRGDMDPFASDFPVHHQGNNFSYDMAEHPGHQGHGFMPNYRDNFPYVQQPGYASYPEVHSHARIAANEYGNVSYADATPVQHPAAHIPNQSHFAALEAQHALRRDALASSASGQLSTPTRGAVDGSPGRSKPLADAPNPDRQGRIPDYLLSPFERAKLYSDNVNISRDLGPNHGGHVGQVAQHHPSGDTKAQTQYPGSNLENPLLQPNNHHQSSVQQLSLLNAGYSYPVIQTASQSQSGPVRYVDAFAHLKDWERPVPWGVARAGTQFPRISMTTPPPGLTRRGSEDEQDPSFSPEELERQEKKREAHARAISGEKTLQEFNDRIREISIEEKDKRIKAGEDEAQADNAAEMTILLGQALVNLSSYVAGDPDGQPRCFANFGPVPDHAIEPSNGGTRSFFDIDPRVDPWRLPPPREDSEDYDADGEGEEEGKEEA